MQEEVKLTPKLFINKVLAGTALGTIIALIPNAVLGAILGYFDHIRLVQMIIQAAVIIQLATPLIIGALIAKQFDFTPPKIMVTAAAAFAGSGVIKFNPEIGAYVGAGTGDIINIMLTASIAVLLLMLIKDSFGSVSLIALPIVIGVGAGVAGMLLYPLVTQITVSIGNVINNFTTLQPVLMSILIALSFGALIISPITTVGIGLAIGLSGMSSGAAAMGIAATTYVLVVNSWTVNEKGVTLAIALGGMKMMMPNLFRTPIILVPCMFTAFISALGVALFNVQGVPQSAGFGLVGLVGPLASLEAGLNPALVLLTWLVIPLAAALASQIIFEKVLKLYDREKVFKFLG